MRMFAGRCRRHSGGYVAHACSTPIRSVTSKRSVVYLCPHVKAGTLGEAAACMGEKEEEDKGQALRGGGGRGARGEGLE